jgi:hypothetical protein
MIDVNFIINDFGLKAGMIWSPYEKSDMGRLVEIGEELIKLVKSTSEIVEFDFNFENKIKKLKNDLPT